MLMQTWLCLVSYCFSYTTQEFAQTHVPQSVALGHMLQRLTVVDTPGPTSPIAIHFMQQKVGYMNIKNIPLQKICHTYPR